MKQFYNLRWYIQHLVDEHEYQYGDNEWTNPLSESNWTYRTNKHFMKYVKLTLQQMTPERLEQNPIIIQHQKLDTEEGEFTKFQEEFTTSEELSDEQESTISNKEERNYSTFSDMSKQDSESDINIDDNQNEQNSHTPDVET